MSDSLAFYGQSGNGPPEGPAERLRVSSGKRSVAASPLPADNPAQPIPALETLYTVAEIALAWKLSEDKVRRIFESEPGVLVLENKGKVYKRRYRTLRIPMSVLQRVYRRNLSLAGGGKPC